MMKQPICRVCVRSSRQPSKRPKARLGLLCYMGTQCSSDANVWLTSSNRPSRQCTSSRRIYVPKADVELQDVSRRGVSRLPGSYGTAASNTEGCWEIIAVGLQGWTWPLLAPRCLWMATNFLAPLLITWPVTLLSVWEEESSVAMVSMQEAHIFFFLSINGLKVLILKILKKLLKPIFLFSLGHRAASCCTRHQTAPWRCVFACDPYAVKTKPVVLPWKFCPLLWLLAVASRWLGRTKHHVS